ncbi:MAG: metal-dependent transcriptional regulator [Proteobacteria bacterium]|nr:metal-dependent transcriptional regulator [Pseudomonadota bacterium]
MEKDAELSENLEDYLEVILELEKTRKVARGKEIAQKLNIQPGSVTGALKTLDKKGLINWEKYGYITLTKKGLNIAENITQRHEVLKNFLVNVLQIEKDSADATACRMEHAIDDTTMSKLVSFIEYLNACPHAETNCTRAFVAYCEANGVDQT